MRLRCPVCFKFKYWDETLKNGESYIQCKNCWSIINKTKLLKRLKHKHSDNKDCAVTVGKQPSPKSSNDDFAQS